MLLHCRIFLQNLTQISPQQLQDLKIQRPPSEFDDGPPCLESLTREKLSDGRDRVLFQYMVYAKKKWPEEWRNKLSTFNHRYFSTPLTDDIIEEKRKITKTMVLNVTKNQCVIIAINNYVRQESLVLAHSYYFTTIRLTDC